MRIFFSVGEPSGDLHGANLIRQLRQREPGLECVGYGGPRMADAGCRLHADLTQLAVMWFARVLFNLHHFLGLLWRARRYFREQQVDAVVLIDYPGFNWWIARAARRRGIPVFYYGVPQLWAWAGWRIKKMRRLVDHVLCKLPFEERWYRQRGCRATYVGHPYYDETARHPLDRDFVERLRGDGRPLVAILPGSRTQEVHSTLPTFLAAAGAVQRRFPRAKFAVAAFNEAQAALAGQMAAASGLEIEVYAGKTPELIHAATCCLACSGSVSLELLHHETPTVILYRIRRAAFWVQKYFRTVQYITLVNVLAARDPFPRRVTDYDPDAAGAEDVPFPEYLTWQDKSEPIAAHVIAWLAEAGRREAKVAQLRQLKQQFAARGASARAAEYILAALSPRRAGHGAPPPPHFAADHAVPAPQRGFQGRP